MGYTIALVSDFFLPVAGGVEVHIYQLAVHLQKRGHRVIVVTHSHPPDRVGIRYLLSGVGEVRSIASTETLGDKDETQGVDDDDDEGNRGLGSGIPKPNLEFRIASLPTFIKVYHLPVTTIASSASLPNFLTCLPYLRNIFIREGIQIVHGHATLSSMAHEALFHARFFTTPIRRNAANETGNDTEPVAATCGGEIQRQLRTIFTDHSLFGFDDAVGILTNKLLAGALRNVDAVICVSHTGKENTSLRAQLNPKTVNVIPNAIVPEQFTPDVSKVDKSFISIVVISRLVYRKGIDLLVASAPHVCAKYPDVRFLVSGDGPKMVELQQMREKYGLQDQVELLGSIRPGDVRAALNRGQIYLTTSLTEAFGMSIIEAACAGLYIVSTKVGGVPEILPHDMIEFALPDVTDVVRALSDVIEKVRQGRSKGDADVTAEEAAKQSDKLKEMYNWGDVAERVEKVYDHAWVAEDRDLFERMARFLDLGIFFGPILCIITAVQYIFLLVLDVLHPRDDIDRVYDIITTPIPTTDCSTATSTSTP